jgi:sugar O-acyltransferase (sialic acid O-acetyltransferase NeuD family)
MKYIILGHCNEVLAGLLDILYKQNIKDIDIVTNMENNSDVPYIIEHINEFNINNYNGKYMNCIMGVNSPKSKIMVFTSFNNAPLNVEPLNYINIIAPNVLLPEKITLGRGINISVGVNIGPYTVIDNFVTINRNVSIGHHCIINKFTTISPGVNIAGHVKIGDNTTIGIGASIINNINIGNNVIIGAGAVVTKDIPDNTVWYGVPAKYIRDNLL